MIDNLANYWSKAHRTKLLDALSGFTLAQHLEYLQVKLPKGGNILCIGAGTGDWIREIKKCQVTVLDICQEALIGFVGTTDPANLPTDYFDLALSQWVAPHMDFESLNQQIYHVLRSLKSNGLFSIHYLEPHGDVRLAYETWVAKAGRVTYLRNEFEQMVISNGGTCNIVSTAPVSYNRTVVVAHIRKT